MKKYISINCKLNWSFWLSIFAIVISLITVALFFWKVDSNSVVNVSTFIGIITAFIGISVTLVIGFQIYSFISIKDKMNEMNSLKNEIVLTEIELKKTKENLTTLDNELRGQILISESLAKAEQEFFCQAFYKLQYALVYFADLDSKKEELQNYVNYLKEYVNKADKKEYKGSSRIFMIKNDVLLIRDSYFKIQNRKYYWVIKDDYEKIFNEFINKIESFKNDDK
mgnify:CR=1 FL=1